MSEHKWKSSTAVDVVALLFTIPPAILAMLNLWNMIMHRHQALTTQQIGSEVVKLDPSATIEVHVDEHIELAARPNTGDTTSIPQPTVLGYIDPDTIPTSAPEIKEWEEQIEILRRRV